MVRPLVLPTYLPTYTCLLTNHLTGWQALPFLELGPTIDRELCEVLGRLFVAAEAGSPCITLISVYMTLQKDGSEAWQRVHTNKAAADGQYAPAAQVAVVSALKTQFMCSAVSQSKNRRFIQGLTGTSSKQAWIVEGIAEREVTGQSGVEKPVRKWIALPARLRTKTSGGPM